MAKYTRYRKYSRRNRAKWSSNIKEFAHSGLVEKNKQAVFTQQLCLNPIQNDNTVSNVYTVKNMDVSAWVEVNTSTAQTGIEYVTWYIMYVPQGMQVDEFYNIQHPEYIMAMKYQGTPGQDNSLPGNNIRIKTRLSRRLQTGDSIILYGKLTNTDTGNDFNFNVNGIARWNTKAN